jgi:hypothetical protein
MRSHTLILTTRGKHQHSHAQISPHRVATRGGGERARGPRACRSTSDGTSDRTQQTYNNHPTTRPTQHEA